MLASLLALALAGSECREPPTPPPPPEYTSKTLVLDIEARNDAFEPVLVLADTTETVTTPVALSLEIIRPDGSTWSTSFMHATAERGRPGCDPAGPDNHSCDHVADVVQHLPAEQLHLPPDAVSSTGTYTAVLRRVGTQDRVSRRFEVAFDAAGRMNGYTLTCDELPEALGDYRRVDCAYARLPLRELRAAWGPRARYRAGACLVTAYTWPLSDDVRLQFQENGLGLPEARRFPEGAVRAQRTSDRDVVGWPAAKHFIAVESSVPAGAEERFLRALLKERPPLAPVRPASDVPKCAEVPSLGSFTIKAESIAHITERDHLSVQLEDGVMVGVELSTLTEGWFFVRAGFRPLDVVLAIDDEPITTPQRARAFLGKVAAVGKKRVVVLRWKDGDVGCLELEVKKP